jgi:hypothetical protein
MATRMTAPISALRMGTPYTLISPMPLIMMTLVSNQAPTSAAMMAPTKPKGSR